MLQQTYLTPLLKISLSFINKKDCKFPTVFLNYLNGINSLNLIFYSLLKT